MFAKALEKCRLLTRIPGQNVEILDDYGCLKIQDLVEKGKRTVRRSALVTLFNTGTFDWWFSARIFILFARTFKPNKQTTWNTSHLHGFAWSSGKLDYEKLFAVFYDIKVMNAEVFAKGLEKCRLLTTLLGQNVENLDDYGCPKIQDLVKTSSSWICSSYPFREKTKLHCAERKTKVYGEWAMQHFKIFVHAYCVCVYYYFNSFNSIWFFL